LSYLTILEGGQLSGKPENVIEFNSWQGNRKSSAIRQGGNLVGETICC